MDFFERQEINQIRDQKKDLAIQADLQRNRESKTSEVLEKDQVSFLGNHPTVSDSLTAFKAINFSQDWGHFVVLVFSIVADLFGFVPYLGAFMGFFFSILFWTIYFVSGQLKNRASAKILISGIIYFFESIGGVLWLSLLPLFTLSAVLIYWLELSQRRASEKNNV